MRRLEYLDDRYVSDFIHWSAHLVTGAWGIDHGWTNGRGRKRKFTSLHDAVEQFEWQGTSFEWVADFFDRCRDELRCCMDTGPDRDEDRDRFLETARKITRWGGIHLPGLKKPGGRAPRELGRQAELLRPEHADTSGLSAIRHMGSGYSKIYCAMIEGFPIYDSRVACALTSLIEIFLRERRPAPIPGTLRLGVPSHRSLGERNLYGFPRISGVREYAASNLKTAWILGAWADRDGRFKEAFKDRNRRIMALQCALFVLGYESLDSCAISK